jgi:predicted ester cyclase
MTPTLPGAPAPLKRWPSGEAFADQPARGRTAFLTLSAVDRVEDGRIVEHWSEFDFPGFLARLA